MLAVLGFTLSGSEELTDPAQQTPIWPDSRRQALVEIVLIFAVFFVQGAWPVPDVNEPYYVGQAIHYWNPDWLQGDFFIGTPNTHRVFCFTFGWLSLLLGQTALVWTGRILTWGLLAWAWRRLSFAVVPRPRYSVLTAALFVCLMERCHMAGEWVVGGVEAKGFAYVFAFLGLEALVRIRWNRALLLFGAASAFHVLVGGWMAVAAGIAWLWLKAWRGSPLSQRERGVTPPLRSLWPGILGGLLLALPGLIPSVTLDRGVDWQTATSAHEIYVFERLPHHLILGGIHPEYVLRLGLLWGFWLVVGWWGRRACLTEDRQECLSSLRAFVAAAVIITLAGTAINAAAFFDRGLAANLLRYYWFRLTDVALPLGVALESVAIIALWCRRPACTPVGQVANLSTVGQVGNLSYGRIAARCLLGLAIVVAGFHVGDRAIDRLAAPPPRSHKMADFAAWRAACDWVANPTNVPPGARFLTPRLAQTFGWYSGHSEVATWKNVPQDAADIIEWWRRIQELYMTDEAKKGTGPICAKHPEGRSGKLDLSPFPRWHGSLAELGAERLRQLGANYDADYVIVEVTEPPLKLDTVYRNSAYVIYRLPHVRNPQSLIPNP